MVLPMTKLINAMYGYIPRDLSEVVSGSLQTSPLIPGSASLADLAPASCASFTLHGPASTIERRHVMALALRALVPGGAFTVLAANDKGGTRLSNELEERWHGL